MQKVNTPQSEELNQFRNLLNDENGVHLNAVLQILLRKLHITDLEKAFFLSEENSDRSLIRFFGYLKIYREIPEIQDLLNHSDFPIKILERFILYLMRFEILQNGEPENTLKKYLPFLDQEKLLQLMNESEFLSRDYEFYMQVFSGLQNRSIDNLLGERSEFRVLLTDMFLKFPPQIISDILSHNPVLYHYIMLFLELDQREFDALDFAATYFPVIEESEQIKEISEIIKKINLDITGDRRQDRGRKISLITSLIMETGKADHTLEILEHQGSFLDEEEHRLVAELIRSKESRNQLHFESKGVDRKELLDWTRKDQIGKKFFVIEN